MRFRTTIPLVVSSLLLAAPAWAADEDSKSAAPKPDWQVGARAHFVTANPILGMFYDQHESVTGSTVGVLLNKRSNDGSTRMIVGLDYTSTSPKDGPWIASGEGPEEAEYTEFRGLSILSVNLMFGHVMRVGPMGFFFGGGVGLDSVSGSITTIDTVNQEPIPGAEKEEKDIPSVVPTLLFKMGPQMEIGKAATVNLDVGFHHGFFVGVSASVNLPI